MSIWHKKSQMNAFVTVCSRYFKLAQLAQFCDPCNLLPRTVKNSAWDNNFETNTTYHNQVSQFVFQNGRIVLSLLTSWNCWSESIMIKKSPVNNKNYHFFKSSFPQHRWKCIYQRWALIVTLNMQFNKTDHSHHSTFELFLIWFSYHRLQLLYSFSATYTTRTSKSIQISTSKQNP